eukprot:g21812.t1
MASNASKEERRVVIFDVGGVVADSPINAIRWGRGRVGRVVWSRDHVMSWCGLGQRATIYLRWALGVLFLTLVAVLFVPATAVGEWSRATCQARRGPSITVWGQGFEEHWLDMQLRLSCTWVMILIAIYITLGDHPPSTHIRQISRCIYFLCFGKLIQVIPSMVDSCHETRFAMKLIRKSQSLRCSRDRGIVFVESMLQDKNWSLVYVVASSLDALSIVGGLAMLSGVSVFKRSPQLTSRRMPAAELRKVAELAGRRVTVEELLDFYLQLGGDEAMPHFDPETSTTNDVVRQMVIPSTLKEDGFGYSYAELCDDRTKGMDGDTATGQALPCCGCRTPKVLNDQPIDCEMNKFDETCRVFFRTEDPELDESRPPASQNMMAYLHQEFDGFLQVVAIDNDFQIFSRAWCVAELVQADASHLEQHMVIHSPDALDRGAAGRSAILRQTILAKIGSPEEVQKFNEHLHLILLGNGGLLACWMDGQRLLQEIGAISARATPGRSGPAQRPFDDSTAVESKEREINWLGRTSRRRRWRNVENDNFSRALLWVLRAGGTCRRSSRVVMLRQAGFVVCALTNNFAEAKGSAAAEALARFRSLFDHFIESASSGMRKPEVAFYQHALQTIGCRAEEDRS